MRRRYSNRGLELLGGMLAVVVSAQARGDTSPRTPAARIAGVAEITYDAPASCPSVEAFAARVQSYLRDSARDTAAVGLGVRVEERADGYALTLRVTTADGSFERPMRDADCGGVIGVAALVAAMAIDPLAAAPDPSVRAVTVTPVDDCEAPPDLFASRPPPSCPGDRDAAPLLAGSRTRMHLRFGVGVDAGTLPALTPGVSVALAVERGAGPVRWQLELGGAYHIEQRTVTRTQPVEAGGHIALWSAVARACGTTSALLGRWTLCAATELGLMQGRGFGYPDPETGSAPWWAAGGSLGYSLPVSKFFSVHAELSAMSGLSRPRFLECKCADCESCPVALVDRIWQPEPIVGRLITGVEWSFP